MFATFTTTPPHLLDAHSWTLYRYQHYTKRLRRARTVKERSYLRAEVSRIRQQLRIANPQMLAA